MAQILFIEDEILLGKSICRALQERKHDCATFTSLEEGLEFLKKNPIDIVLLDIHLPGMSGIEALQEIKKYDPGISVIITSAYATMTSVVEALRFGASDFLRKPLDIDEVVLAIDRTLKDTRLKQEISYYHEIEAEKTDEDKMIANSNKMQEILQIVRSVTAMDLPSASEYPPVLIVGETGVGKDLLSRLIHYQGKLSDKPFIEVNCTTLPKGLEEAELFGYEKGAFTGADRFKVGLFDTANGGTLFLNEIGDISMETQVKLLQVIEQKTIRRVGGLKDIDVDVHIIAASNRDLQDTEKFRSDLYYRLNNLTINVPSLRNRKEDIVELSQFYLDHFSKKYKIVKVLSESAKEALLEYNWPGNVRELRQLMERVTFMKSEKEILPTDLNLQSVTKKSSGRIRIYSSFEIELNIPENGLDLEMLDKQIILQALRQFDGNVSLTARKLYLGREALRYRIKKYEIFKVINIVD